MSSYRASRAFLADDLRTFLQAVDRHLPRSVRIEIIGGSAAALAHGATSTTVDVDTFTPTTVDLDTAVERAVAETGLEITLVHATVAEVPINYDERLVRQLPELASLEVWVLEKHDLVLSKAVRCYEHDLQQLREIRDAIGLSFDTLVDRYRDEMDHVLGDPARVRSNFLLAIEELFGETKRVAAGRRIGGRPGAG
jgi:hypothetical protein